MNNRFEIAREFANRIKSDEIKKIILFGSVARGRDTEDSDIDILIISPESAELESRIDDLIYEFIIEKDELIYAHVMSESHFNKHKDNHFLQNDLKEGVIIGWWRCHGNFNLAKEELISAKILLDAGRYRDCVTLSYYAILFPAHKKEINFIYDVC